jgi:ElaB/YqjD/DUF883 family membrane-anchored ribosome-binding protein
MAKSRSSQPDLRDDVDAIKDDIAALKMDLSAAMRDLIEVGKNEAGEKKAQIEDAIRARLDRLNDAAHNVADRGRRVVEGTQHYIEEKPFQSIAIAFGVGILLGAVLRK